MTTKAKSKPKKSPARPAAAPAPKVKAAAPKPKPGSRATLHAQRIKVLVPQNPKREGTAAHKKYEVYKAAKTVGEALEKGAKVGFAMSTIRWDLRHKFIELVG